MDRLGVPVFPSLLFSHHTSDSFCDVFYWCHHLGQSTLTHGSWHAVDDASARIFRDNVAAGCADRGRAISAVRAHPRENGHDEPPTKGGHGRLEGHVDGWSNAVDARCVTQRN